MGRLTKKTKSNVPPVILKALGIEDVPTENVEVIKTDDDICGEVCKKYKCRDCPINEAFEKLAHYEDLEEQGRLIEQKHGRWIHKDDFIGKYLTCSECSHVTGRKSNYCSNCDAKMKGDKNGLD